jgi:DNA polymerase-4
MRRVLYLWVPHLHTAVERGLLPGLVEEPVVVAAGSFARGTIVDASPEAEALGVGAGQSWRHARRHAPMATFIPYEAARYRPFTERIGGLLHELTPWVETLPGSEEEFFADLGAGPLEEGEILARGALAAIHSELGLEARAVLATGKLVARTACRHSGVSASNRDRQDRQDGRSDPFPSDHPVYPVYLCELSPYHLITVPPGTERRFLRPLPLDYLWDMQPEHRRRLGPLGLRTFGQLAAVPQRMLIGQFGPVGRWYRLLAAGIDARRVKPWVPHPAVSSRLIIEEEPADLPLLEGYLELLARRVSDTLIATGQYTRVISLMLETDRARPFASRHLKAPTNLAEPIRRAGHELLVLLLQRMAGVPNSNRDAQDGQDSSADFAVGGFAGLLPGATSDHPVHPVYPCEFFGTPERLTLVASGLEARGLIQLSLFGDPERGAALRAAIARIQDRFGEAAIAPAASVASGQWLVARRRSGFGKSRSGDAADLAAQRPVPGDSLRDEPLTTDHWPLAGYPPGARHERREGWCH